MANEPPPYKVNNILRQNLSIALIDTINARQLFEFASKVEHPLDWYNDAFSHMIDDNRYRLTLAFPDLFRKHIGVVRHGISKGLAIINNSWWKEMSEVARRACFVGDDHEYHLGLMDSDSILYRKAISCSMTQIDDLICSVPMYATQLRFQICRGIAKNPNANALQLCAAVELTPASYGRVIVFKVAMRYLTAPRVSSVANTVAAHRELLISIESELFKHICKDAVGIVFGYVFRRGPVPLIP